MSATSFVRFSVKQRIEHISMMTLFIVLSLTGFPQKFFGAAWAASFVDALGGIGCTRVIHRFSGALFSVLVVAHLGTAIYSLARRRAVRMTMVPTRTDFRDAVNTLKYYLGLTKEHPKFDRFDYRQKFEYWGLIFGAVVMVVTGAVLYFPILASSVLPGQFIPASKVMHSNEGLMAFLVVIVWHIYNAHLNPDVFPFDTSIFTGKISRERMEKEHPLELARHEAAASAGERGGGG